MSSRSLLYAGVFGLGLLAWFVAPAARAETFSTGPSAYCHVTDGTFTDCGGNQEWSDILKLDGVGTSAGAAVYTDQSVAPPRLLLMYDLTGHTAPLAPDSFFDITFHVVEHNELEEYRVECFGDGTFKVFEEGVDITDEADTVDCAVGFDGRVLVELEIDTLVTYSPDIPLFWSTHAPESRPPCPPEDPNCRPGTQASANPVQTSASVVIASSNGTTQVAGLPVGAFAPEDLCNRATGGGILVDLMMLLPASNHGQRVRRATQSSRQALDSLVGFGLLSRQQARKIHGCVVSTLARG